VSIRDAAFGRFPARAGTESAAFVDNWPNLVDISRPLWTIGTLATPGRYPSSTGNARSSAAHARSVPGYRPAISHLSSLDATLAREGESAILHTVHTPTRDGDG